MYAPMLGNDLHMHAGGLLAGDGDTVAFMLLHSELLEAGTGGGNSNCWRPPICQLVWVMQQQLKGHQAMLMAG